MGDGSDNVCWNGTPVPAATPGNCSGVAGGGGGGGTCFSYSLQQNVVAGTYVTSVNDGLLYVCGDDGAWYLAQ
jgi:hypothetical protein